MHGLELSPLHMIYNFQHFALLLGAAFRMLATMARGTRLEHSRSCYLELDKFYANDDHKVVKMWPFVPRRNTQL